MILEFAKAFLAMFIIIDPLASVPVFLGLTRKATEEQKNAAAREAVLVAGLALVLFILIGMPTLELMGISFPSFKVAGGIVLLIVGVYSILGIPFSEAKKELDVAVVLLAVPMITGPGAMSMAIIISKEQGILIAILASLLAVLVTWAVLRFASSLTRAFGTRGLEIYSRLFGLFVVALAIQFISEGIRAMVVGNA